MLHGSVWGFDAQLVNATFGLRVRELLHCSFCGRDIRVRATTQRLHAVSTSGLRAHGGAEPGHAPTSLVRSALGALCPATIWMHPAGVASKATLLLLIGLRSCCIG